MLNNITTPFSLEFDLAHDMTLGELSEFASEHKILSYSSMLYFGPAGGNPLITFYFQTQHDLDNFLEKM